ncbi:hypothetical protein PGTDC60_1951 [Porphyromonas gingivalis TDC60]|nr:hypothetical protein PGTDC60_1951 [Porphyromonas gingivalis TDC60]
MVGRKIRPHEDLIFVGMIVSKHREKALRWRFFALSAGLDLAGSKGNRHTFARPITASGTLREPYLQRNGLISFAI